MIVCRILNVHTNKKVSINLKRQRILSHLKDITVTTEAGTIIEFRQRYKTSLWRDLWKMKLVLKWLHRTSDSATE